ncbi:hypothetical protein [Flavobacterium poyangense]|uniref:hypothetical protein n=1 Tax=Flavobacterium poyangense TaxID=2204302 RepID=UPI0014213F0B|nr:hypothetical protein [Flavobacterium sp. JXAS1]
MGNLKINKVTYSGTNYHYESPTLQNGINIITGDNGSGKSTFTYFIEYGLGSNLKYFNPDSKKEKYQEIINDKNNYVELDININNENYRLKRFINSNDIFINFEDEYFSFPINRQSGEEIFSDWLLTKLEINISELNLGTRTWKINFSDLLRLIIYDQETESKKIFKEPANLNFITDSLIIRKTIFEILLGISSDDFFKKHDEFKETTKKRDLEISKLNDFNTKFSGIDLDIITLNKSLDEYNSQLESLYSERSLYLSSNTKVDEKADFINQIQNELILTDLKISEVNISLNNYKIEYDKISKLFENQSNEISEIEKIIFTNDKLNLFSFKICPFCMKKHEPKENFCLCGEEILDEDYEKFVYNSNEYKSILNHKKKSLETIQIALDSYSRDINIHAFELDKLNLKSNDLTKKITQLISSLEFSGNSELIDNLNDKILETKKEIDKYSLIKKIAQEKIDLDESYNSIDRTYKTVKKEFEDLQREFDSNNKSMITDFNSIYEFLLQKSSAKISYAEIDEDYMPVLDGGIYKNKSTDVPVRLLYYFTILTLALKYNNVKHPKLLIIDTPEDSGIDDNHLKNDLNLLTTALNLIESEEDKQYQVILTTGLEKYPDEFRPYILDSFDKENGKFILNKRDLI